MILIVTHKQDFTVDFVVEKLNHRGIPYRRLNCEDIDSSIYSFNFSSSSSYSLLGCDHFDSIWFRRTKLPELSDKLTQGERDYILTEYYSLIQNILLAVDAKLLSNPTKIYAAENKMYQLSMAIKVGFKIPNTIVTNSKSEITSFFNSMNQDIIIKPISENKIVEGENQRLIFTNKLSPANFDQLEKYDLTPAIVQQNIPKQYEVRVTIVEDSVFSARIMSQSDASTRIDWRRKQLPVESYQLPAVMETKCIELVKTLGLSFGALDLIRAPDGDYYFLEINPNGQWAWIEVETGLPISNAITKFLT